MNYVAGYTALRTFGRSEIRLSRLFHRARHESQYVDTLYYYERMILVHSVYTRLIRTMIVQGYQPPRKWHKVLPPPKTKP